MGLMNESNQLAKSYDYDAFGVEKNPSDEDSNPFRYCGEYYDVETGTYYLRARYYDPRIGRFTQQDRVNYVKNKLPNGNEVIDPLSLNLYVYCQSNPSFYQDPNGNFVITTATIVCLAMAAVFGTIGGIVGNTIAINNQVPESERWMYIATGAMAGASIRVVAGAFAAPYVAAATGIAGISITSAGISTIGTTIMVEGQYAFSVWDLNPFDRGYAIEKALGGWCDNFPVIDKASGKGISESITSIKSMDLSLASYQNGNSVYNKIMSYVESLKNFIGDSRYGHHIKVNSNTQRILEFVIPSEGTPKQIEQINRAIADAKNIGITVKPIIMK